MPIYEYQCAQCAHIFEEWQHSHEDEGEKPCPACGAAAHRVVSHTSFILKGSGWYVTEYGNRHGSGPDGEGTIAAKDSDDEKAVASSGDNATSSDPAAQSAPAADKPDTAKPATEKVAVPHHADKPRDSAPSATTKSATDAT